MRRAMVSLVIILMGIVILMATLWFLGRETDTTRSISTIERLKRVQKEHVLNVAKRVEMFAKRCKTYPSKRGCMQSQMEQELKNLLQANIKD